MTGVLYRRLPGGDDSEIHLWRLNYDGNYETYCGKEAAELEESNFLVIQKEGFKQANEGVCDECLRENPKTKKYVD